MLGAEISRGRGGTAMRPVGGVYPRGTLLWELDGVTDGEGADAARAALMRTGTGHTYEAGEIMLLAGATDTFVLVLLSGFAKVTTTDGRDAAVLVDIRAGGDVVGETAAFDNEPRSATVTAFEKVRARRISQDEWLGWMARHRAAGLAVSRSLAHRSRTAVRRRTQFTRGPVIARLCRAVLDLTEQYGVRTPEGLSVRPGLTHAEWGELIGARERRVQHALQELRTAEAVSYGRCRLTVRSVSALRSIAVDQ
ncbi:Crp/Fnr family transcriptional regulator [Streptomyces sp. WAC05374]|nr:Crp/Fnr family transcriptional regulator [Streptomyces sp. WAC05374]TDF41090.1 Crp/Fnr family transcriptional regulator [Streptomyces sp. WAC05374]TDF49751.1 Crp/Fnr family transcriptional regulator [Streptomyces sp. WAC05374]TDF51360.1 Crp/Fnr family transcriptional regulator [Streptomyces sp. WAC05374]